MGEPRPWNSSVDAIEGVMLKHREDSLKAVEMVDSVRHMISTIEANEVGLPVKPLEGALTVALEEAYESICLWRSAREEWRRAIARASAVPKANQG